MEDIAPQLIQAVTDEFHRLYNGSSKIQTLLGKVKKRTATYAEAQEYAIEVAELIRRAYEKHVSSATLPDGKMYYNIADRLIPETLDENYRLVSQYAANVQTSLNKNAGTDLKAQIPELEQDRVDGLVDLASNADRYDDVADQLLTAFENFSQHIVDETIRKNADFHYGAGMSPKIIRKSHGKCCKWCKDLAKEYDYRELYDSDDPRAVFRRHENCRCTVLYDPADGSKSLQNVHTKKVLSKSEESDMMIKRQIVGLHVGKTAIKDISAHTFQRLKERNVTAEAIKDALEHPLKTSEVKYDAEGRPSVTLTGRKATVSINPDTGIIVTVYPTHTKTAQRLMEGK